MWCKNQRVPPQSHLVCQAPEPDETRALIGTARDWWPRGGAVLLGMYLALRRFEIAKAEWSRFDASMQWYRVTGKRDKTATTPVHPIIRDEFATRRSDGFLLLGRFGGPISPATVWAWISEVARVAGLGHVRTHQATPHVVNDRVGQHGKPQGGNGVRSPHQFSPHQAANYGLLHQDHGATITGRV